MSVDVCLIEHAIMVGMLVDVNTDPRVSTYNSYVEQCDGLEIEHHSEEIYNEFVKELKREEELKKWLAEDFLKSVEKDNDE